MRANRAVDAKPDAVSPSPLAVAAEKMLAPKGPLAQVIPGYERRAEQLSLTRAVACTVECGGRLLAEAGTGIGKTLAYVVPLVLSGRRAIVSTATKALQDQLVDLDAPLLARALRRPLSVRLMKGRANYLCLHRAAQTLVQSTLPGVDERDLLPSIIAWAQQTTTGDRDELRDLPDNSALWRELTSTSDQCHGRACAHYDRCFITLMRRRAQDADIVVVNHHLYFADMSLRLRSLDTPVTLLPAHDVVVFDEAHEIEEVAAQHFGHEVAERQVLSLTRDIIRAAVGDRGMRVPLQEIVVDIERACRKFFDNLPVEDGRQAFVDWASYDVVLALSRELSGKLQRGALAIADLAFEDAVLLARRASLLADELGLVFSDSRQVDTGAAEAGVSDTARRDYSSEYAQPFFDEAPTADCSPGDTEPVWVRYSERVGRHRAVVARPVEVASFLQDHLHTPAALFVSATLTVNRSFAFFSDRLGIVDAETLVVDSPFDYRQQVVMYLPNDLPEPDDATFAAQATHRVVELVLASGGGAFVLCTSHRMLATMGEALAETGLPTLTQGEAPKPQLVERFRALGNAVLCATLSFWQGIDVPGRALRLVIIDRVPFASPADPLLAARLQHLRQRGRDPFRDYQLPQAALLLRQGFGRLVRRQTDKGMVALLDRRLTARPYGSVLLQSLPLCHRVEQRQDALAALAELNRVCV